MRAFALFGLILSVIFTGWVDFTRTQAQGTNPTATPTVTDDTSVIFSSNVRVRATRNSNISTSYKVIQIGEQWFVENTATQHRILLPADFSAPYGAMILTTPDPAYLLIKTYVISFYSLHLPDEKVIYLGDPTENIPEDQYIEDRVVDFTWADTHQFVMMFRSMPEWSYTYAVVGDVTQQNSVQIALKNWRLGVHFTLEPPRLEKWDTPFNPPITLDISGAYDTKGNIDCTQTIYDIQSKKTQTRHFKAYCYPAIQRSTGVAYYAAQLESMFRDYDTNLFPPFDDALSLIVRFDPNTSVVRVLYSGVFDSLVWLSADEHTALVGKRWPGTDSGGNHPNTYYLLDLEHQMILKNFSVFGVFTGDTLDDGRLFLIKENTDAVGSSDYKQSVVLFDPKTTIQKLLFEVPGRARISIQKVEASLIMVRINRSIYDSNTFLDAQYEIELTAGK